MKKNSNFLNYEFVVDNENKLNFKRLENTFIPTGTSAVLFNAIKHYKFKPGKTLDLGAGIGVIGLLLFKFNLAQTPLYASDLSADSVQCIIKNAQNYNCPIVCKLGSMFEPWENEKFDLIINDISGVSQEVAEISPWFNNVPCESGSDGTKLTNEILLNAPKFLNDNGLFFFPIISLSNTEKILSEANKNFKHVKELERKEWPLPKEMQKYISKLEKLRERKLIEFKNKFGITIFNTSVYVAFN